MSQRKTVMLLTEQTAKKIQNGDYGRSGSLFLSLREFAKRENVSYVTAQRTAQALRREGLLLLFGNHLYVTCGTIRRSSALARELELRRSEKKLIGMYINKMTNAFFTTIAGILSSELDKRGYELIIQTGNGNEQKEKQVLESFVAMGVQAVVSCPGHDGQISGVYKNFILPTIFIGRLPENCAQSSAVLVNNVNAGKQVAAHLLETGCVSFGYIGTNQLSDQNDKRLEGFKKGLESSGYTLSDELSVLLSPEITPATANIIRNLIKKAPKPLGLFCYHDIIAINVISICNRAGIKIPEQVRIVGFDDLPVTEFVTPTLTSISYRFDRMAQEVANEVEHLIQNPDKPTGSIYIRQSLIIRQSSRPALL